LPSVTGRKAGRTPGNRGRIADVTWQKYDHLRSMGVGIVEASRRCAISQQSAWRREKRIKAKHGEYGPAMGKVEILNAQGHQMGKPAFVSAEALRGAIPFDELSKEAFRALSDFAYFRYRYFGRKSTPWQEEAGNQIEEWLLTERKEYAVVNCPPGSGKSTLFTLDIPAWLTTKRRSIRGLIGSASQTLAENYIRRLKNALESPWPMRAESEEMDAGLAFDAEASLLSEYGLFKVEGTPLWAAHAFIVGQSDNRPLTEKEPTWSGYGLDSAFIGGRFDICIWDDVQEDRHLVSLDRIDKARDRWDKVAEKRLEPRGLLVLQGQRLSPEDLYRHSLNKKAGSSEVRDHEGCCEAEPGRKYHHIRYRAHYETFCSDEHNPGDYYPNGCLLDPYRLPWIELEAEMENHAGNFAQVYQQEDTDPERTLVDMFWIKGGRSVTGEIFPGCWDWERDLWELPNISLPYISYLCVDPSPKNYWGITLWVYHPATQLRFLMALHNTKMRLEQFFDWSDPDRRFVGLLPEWYDRSVTAGYPLTTLIFEQNAAQRFFLATDALRRWQQQTGVRVIGHETSAANKLDPELGPQQLGPLYRRGLVRLPHGSQAAALGSLKLIDEVTRYPMGRKDDLTMSQWFGEADLSHIYARKPPERYSWRPSWMAAAR
jgi:hypothetical protein